jgi:hypothetical protein
MVFRNRSGGMGNVRRRVTTARDQLGAQFFAAPNHPTRLPLSTTKAKVTI